jgi:hypothetical protein
MKYARKYKIEFWGDGDKVPFSPQIKKEILDLMFNEFQGTFIPERYNTFEPVKKIVVSQDELLKVWNDDDDFSLILKKITSPKMEYFSIGNAYKKTLGHHIYRLIFYIGKRVKTKIIEEFINRMIDITKPFFCLATSDLHWDERCIVKYFEVGGDIQHVIFSKDERFCGIFWRTYFSKIIVDECHWGEIMNNLPCECQKMPDGYMLKVYDDCFNPDWDKEEAIINILGRKYIADVKTYYQEHNLIPVD